MCPEEGLIEIATVQPISSATWHWAGASGQFEAIIKDQDVQEAKLPDRHKVLDEKDLDELCEERCDSKSSKNQAIWAVRTLQGIFCGFLSIENTIVIFLNVMLTRQGF